MGLVASFNYCYKQLGRWMPWLYLYGAGCTGKTTLGEIVLNMWALGLEHRKSDSGIDAVPKLCYVLGSSTLVNEPGRGSRGECRAVMRNAIESTVVCGKFVRGTYMEIPSLAPLVMTSNRVIPRDDELLRRIIVLRSTFGERIGLAKASEFERKVKPKLGV